MTVRDRSLPSLAPSGVRLTAALAAAAVLTGCALDPDRMPTFERLDALVRGAPEAGPEMAPASLPAYAPGDAFAYDDGLTETVKTVTGERVRWEVGPDYTFEGYRNFALPRLSWSWRKDDEKTVSGTAEVEVAPQSLWPLEVGNRARFHSRHQDIDEDGRPNTYGLWWECAVDATETVTVPAGTFDTYRVRCYQSYFGRVYQTTIWHYAPQVGHFVQRRQEYSQASPRTARLVAYGPAPEALSERARDRLARTVQTALETRPSGETERAVENGLEVAVTPLRTTRREDGTYCRSYRQELTARGRTSLQESAACRGEDGVWRTP